MTRVVCVFLNPESSLRLVTAYLMEYSEEWSIIRSFLNEESPQSSGDQAAWRVGWSTKLRTWLDTDAIPVLASMSYLTS